MRRLTALSLVLAFLLALVAPAQAIWACPDGTPCVHDTSQGAEGYRCSGSQCETKAPVCCRVRTTRCKHGAVPGLAEQHSGAAVSSPDHCRYRAFKGPDLTARLEHSSKFFAPKVGALPLCLLLEIAAVSASAVRLGEDALGCRPPPYRLSWLARGPPSL